MLIYYRNKSGISCKITCSSWTVVAVQRKNTLNAKISDLNSQLRAAENQLQNIKSQISSTQADLAEWRRIKTNASYDMEYYRRKMQEAV